MARPSEELTSDSLRRYYTASAGSMTHATDRILAVNLHDISERSHRGPDTNTYPPERHVARSRHIPPSEKMFHDIETTETSALRRDLAGKRPQRSPSLRSDANAGTPQAKQQILVTALRRESTMPVHEKSDGCKEKVDRTVKESR